MIFEEIEAALSLRDRFNNWRKKDKVQPPKTVASRFVQLFEAHNIHRNQIPRFFGHGLEIANVKDDNTLHNHLTENILDNVCQLFAIRREWLDCAEDQIYEIHSFYKNIEAMNGYLDDLKANGSEWLSAELIFSACNKEEDDTLLVIDELIGYVGDKPIYRYHLISNWRHTYWKCRPEIAACIAMLSNKNIHLKGRFVKESIGRFCDGYKFYNSILNFRSISPIGWHPDVWVYDPIEFCKGLKEGNFGKENALAIWIDYYHKGLMTTGYSRPDSIHRFTNELAKPES